MQPSPPARLTIGKVIGVFGVRGEVKVRIETDFPERFATLTRVYLDDAEHTAESSRIHKGMALLKLAGVDDPEHAAELIGCQVDVALADAVPLKEGQYFFYQIIGLQAMTADGEALGEVTEVLRTGSNDVYVVKGEQGELLIPAIDSVVKQIDVARGRIVVELMEGMR